jgi:hypothetical protein
MIDSQDKRLIQLCHTLLMYNLGGLTEVSKTNGVLRNIHQHQSITVNQRYFLTEWYQENQDQLDWMRL